MQRESARCPPACLAGSSPHGGRLTPRLATSEEREDWLQKAPGLPSVTLTTRQVADLECLAVGAFSPLDGFLRQSDYESVVEDMRLACGLVWSLPITLAVTVDEVQGLKGCDDVALRAPRGGVVAILHL
jgi:sulfate adenylyltransferase